MKTANLLAALVLGIVTAVAQDLSVDKSQWKRIGPEGGTVAALVADPRNPSNLYATTRGGSLFKTGDGGASWSALDGLPDVGFSAVLALDPQNTATAYAARCSDILKTADGGATWTLVSSLRMPCLQALVLGSTGTLFASSSDPGEIRKSTDGGVTWTQVSSGVALLAIDPQNEETMYANGAGAALFKSTDGGASWNSILTGSVVSGLVIDPQNSATLYARAWWRIPPTDGPIAQRILKSTDEGASWTSLGFGIAAAPGPGFVDSVPALAISPSNSARIYALVNRFSDSPGVGPRSDFFLVMSSDAGMTWTTATDPHLAMADLVTILPDPQDESTLYVGTTGGVLKSTDAGAHWDFANSGLRAAPARQVVFNSQLGFSVTDRNAWHGTALFKSTDGGRNWSPSSAGLPWGIGNLIADPQNPQTLYTGGPHNGGAGSFFGNGLFKSTDSGASWSEVWYNATWGASLRPLVISPRDSSIMYVGVSICSDRSYGCDSRIARSDDQGRTWTRSQAALSSVEYISALAIDPRNPNVIYASTADVGGWGAGGLFKSVDAGVSWRKLSDGAVYLLLIDPGNPDTIVSGGWSTDGGETWSPLNIPCDPYFGAFAFDPQGSGTLYCGDNARVFRTADAGKSWSAVGTGLRGRVNSLTFDALEPTTLYAATSGGVFAVSLNAQP